MPSARRSRAMSSSTTWKPRTGRTSSPSARSCTCAGPTGRCTSASAARLRVNPTAMADEVTTAADTRRLVERAQQGDRQALEELYLMHFDRIYSYLHMSVGNRHDAEDLTTQTFTKMLESIKRFRWQSAPFSAWLFRIAHNLAMDHFRASRRWQPEEEVPEPPGETEPSAEIAAFQSIGRQSLLELSDGLSL